VRMVRQWVDQTVGGLPRQFWYLWANTLINRIGSFVVIVLAIYLTQERGFTETFAGLVIGLWGAGGAAGTLVGGVLADRWGRKPTVLTAMYSSAGLMVGLGLARGPVEIAIIVVLLGFVSESTRPAMTALMIDVVPEADRVRAFSLNYWVINLGFAFAATTAGLVANIDYLLLFSINAATTLLSATLVAVAITEPRRRTSHSQPQAGQTERLPAPKATPGLLAVFSDKVFMAYVAVNLLTSLVFMQHMSTLPMAMGRDGLPPSTFGSVIAVNGVLIVAGQLFVPRLLRDRSRAATLAVAAVIFGIGFGLNAFAHTAMFYAIAVLVWTVGEMLNSPSNSATNAELSPADMRGRYQGVFSLSWSVASFLAPIAGAALLEYAGATALWLSCLGLALVVAALHLVSGPARERRAAQLAAAEQAPTQLAPADLAEELAGLTAQLPAPSAPSAPSAAAALATSEAGGVNRSPYAAVS
jgi:MFS family permease